EAAVARLRTVRQIAVGPEQAAGRVEGDLGLLDREARGGLDHGARMPGGVEPGLGERTPELRGVEPGHVQPVGDVLDGAHLPSPPWTTTRAASAGSTPC